MGNPIRYIGEKVRYYRCGPGWMFGTVTEVHPPEKAGDGWTLEYATVFFPGRQSVYGGYATETTRIASFLLERCQLQ